MRCASAHNDLTALVDGALAPARASEVRAHVETCPSCRREIRELERTVALQSEALAPPLPDLSLGFETRLRQRLAEVEEGSRLQGWFGWIWRPAIVLAGAGAAVLLAAAPLGGPSSVLVPLGIQSPPPRLAKEPELFRDYAIIEHLDELQNFDTVEAIPLDDDTWQVEDKGSG